MGLEGEEFFSAQEPETIEKHTEPERSQRVVRLRASRSGATGDSRDERTVPSTTWGCPASVQRQDPRAERR